MRCVVTERWNEKQCAAKARHPSALMLGTGPNGVIPRLGQSVAVLVSSRAGGNVRVKPPCDRASSPLTITKGLEPSGGDRCVTSGPATSGRIRSRSPPRTAATRSGETGTGRRRRSVLPVDDRPRPHSTKQPTGKFREECPWLSERHHSCWR
jgi:hypothetical protein